MHDSSVSYIRHSSIQIKASVCKYTSTSAEWPT